jgi:hypothetical protein
MPHEIRTSARRSFRSCRRRWNWAYRQGYVPEVTPKPLEFGLAFHAGLEDFYCPERWDSTQPVEKLQYAVEKFIAVCETQREEYLTVTNQRALPNAEGDDYSERIELGIGMLTYYAMEIHPERDMWFRPVATELTFEVPLYDALGNQLLCKISPECGQDHDDELVVYAGRIDMLVEDILNGGYFVWDHKSCSQLAYDDGFLQLDDQVGSYTAALQRQLNIDVRGFVYAEYRKAFPSPPAILSRLSGGRAFSVGKNQATTLEIYRRTVQEMDTQAFEDGCYTEYLAWLNSKDAPKFHQRFVIIKTDEELANIWDCLTEEAQDMIDPNLRLYPSVGKFVCGNCAYRQPCVGQFRGEDHIYTLNSLFKKVR